MHNITCLMLQIISTFPMLTLLCKIHGQYSSLFINRPPGFSRDRPHTHPRDRGIGKEQRVPRGCGPTQSQHHNSMRPTLNYSSGCGGHLSSSNNHSSQSHRVRASKFLQIQCYQRCAKHNRTIYILNDCFSLGVHISSSVPLGVPHRPRETNGHSQLSPGHSKGPLSNAQLLLTICHHHTGIHPLHEMTVPAREAGASVHIRSVMFLSLLKMNVQSQLLFTCTILNFYIFLFIFGYKVICQSKRFGQKEQQSLSTICWSE